MSQKEVNAEYIFDVSVFRERFHKLRKSFKLSQAEFAAFLEIPTGSVGGYESGDKTPNSATLFKIAKKCNISTDYLLGLSDVQSTNAELKAVCEYTGLSEKAINVIRGFYELSKKESDSINDWFACTQIQGLEFLEKFITSYDLYDLTFRFASYHSELEALEKDVDYLFNELNSKSVSDDIQRLSTLKNEAHMRLKVARCYYYDGLETFKECINEYIGQRYKKIANALFSAELSYLDIVGTEGGQDNGEHN